MYCTFFIIFIFSKSNEANKNIGWQGIRNIFFDIIEISSFFTQMGDFNAATKLSA